MVKTFINLCSAFLLVLVAACLPIPKATAEVIPPNSTQTPAESVAPATETPGSVLNSEYFQNFEFFAPNFERPVQLTDGGFSETDVNGRITVTLLPQIAIGDLNGDQVDDAVVLLGENGGGTGTFVSLVVLLSQDGQIQQVGSDMLDDRPIVNSLSIQDGSIYLDFTGHGINDSMANPTLNFKKNYRLLDEHLTLMKLTTTVQGGTERSVTIDAPVEGSVVSGSVQMKGSMPSAPFENNLSFIILDMAGTELFQTGFMVTSADVGGPATFDSEVTLPILPSGSMVRLQLVEMSMADGSMVDMDSVIVKIK